MYVNDAHDLNGDRRRERDERHHAEGVRDDVAAERGARAHGQRQQEGGGHGSARHAAGVEGDAHEHGRDIAREDERERVARHKDPVDADAGQHAHHRQHHRAGHADGQRRVHHALRHRAAGDILDLLVEHLHGGLRLDDVVADERADRDEHPAVRVVRQA